MLCIVTMNSYAHQYQFIYNVALLDDLHNYFPSLLYDMDRFQTLPQVFYYVRQQMNARFNLYNYGASQQPQMHFNSMPHMTPVAPMHPMPPMHPMHQAAPPMPPMPFNFSSTNPTNSSSPATPRMTRQRDSTSELSLLASLLNNFSPEIWTIGVGGGGRGIGANVIVRPSPEIITQATEVISGSTLAEGTICSICQDVIVPTDSARKLRVCRHIYHQSCIDQWFERSVLCPTCRHDVREGL